MGDKDYEKRICELHAQRIVRLYAETVFAGLPADKHADLSDRFFDRWQQISKRLFRRGIPSHSRIYVLTISLAINNWIASAVPRIHSREVATARRFADVLGFFLPSKLREKVWTPAFEELFAEWVKKRSRYRSRMIRRFLFVGVCFRSILILCDTLRVWSTDGTMRWLKQALGHWFPRFPE